MAEPGGFWVVRTATEAVEDELELCVNKIAETVVAAATEGVCVCVRVWCVCARRVAGAECPRFLIRSHTNSHTAPGARTRRSGNGSEGVCCCLPRLPPRRAAGSVCPGARLLRVSACETTPIPLWLFP